MTMLHFDGDDPRDLLGTLIEAVRITDETGERPSVEVDGQVYAGNELIRVARLLPEEALREGDAARVAEIFEAPQHEYRRTAYNLALRAARIVARNSEQRALLHKL